jgi:hypothetical protein
MRLAHLSIDTIIDEGSVEIATSIKRVTRDEQTIANGQVNAQDKLSLLTSKEDEADVDIFSVIDLWGHEQLALFPNLPFIGIGLAAASVVIALGMLRRALRLLRNEIDNLKRRVCDLEAIDARRLMKEMNSPPLAPHDSGELKRESLPGLKMPEARETDATRNLRPPTKQGAGDAGL